MKVTIQVEYPTTVEVVKATAEEMQAKGYKNHKGIIQYVAVNRPQAIKVKQVARKVQEEFMDSADYEKELNDMSIAQTGLTIENYQAKHGKAWND